MHRTNAAIRSAVGTACFFHGLEQLNVHAVRRNKPDRGSDNCVVQLPALVGPGRSLKKTNPPRSAITSWRYLFLRAHLENPKISARPWPYYGKIDLEQNSFFLLMQNTAFS
jgi:hypothetical protein